MGWIFSYNLNKFNLTNFDIIRVKLRLHTYTNQIIKGSSFKNPFLILG